MEVTWQTALGLALFVERVVEYLAAPLYERYWKEGRWTLMYVSGIVGFFLSLSARIDLMAAAGLALPYPINLVVSAVIVGGGGSLVSEVSDILKGVGSLLGEHVEAKRLENRSQVGGNGRP